MNFKAEISPFITMQNAVCFVLYLRAYVGVSNVRGRWAFVSCCLRVVEMTCTVSSGTLNSIIHTSHTRTVVRECCKGYDASQWENGKFDPLPRPNPLTYRHKNCTRDYIMDVYRCAKFSHDP